MRKEKKEKETLITFIFRFVFIDQRKKFKTTRENIQKNGKEVKLKPALQRSVEQQLTSIDENPKYIRFSTHVFVQVL